MKPSQVAEALTHIAFKIKNSRNPDRFKVAVELKEIISRLAATKEQLQDHTKKFGKYVVRVKHVGGWDRSMDGMGGRYKTREEADARAKEMQESNQTLVGRVKVTEEDDGSR